jgi:transposase
MRQVLVGSRTKLINTVRGWLRQQVIHLRTGKAESFPVRVREAFNERPPYVDRQLEAIDALTTQILAADEDMTQLAEQDEVCTRLMSTPGVGPQTVLRFKCSIDTVERFPNAAQLESYIGLTPGEDSSSERTRRTGINKAGDATLRALLIQSAWSIRRCRPNDPIVQWNKAVEKRRGKKVAVVALARKIAGILYAMWRDGTTYNPAKAASALQDANCQRAAQHT